MHRGGMDGRVDTGNGVYGSSQRGGGIFSGNPLYGLGTSPAARQIRRRYAAVGIWPFDDSETEQAAADDAAMRAQLAQQEQAKQEADITTPTIATIVAEQKKVIAAQEARVPTGPPAIGSPDSRVKNIQVNLNSVLAAAKLPTHLGEDGKLGSGTCGAIAWFDADPKRANLPGGATAAGVIAYNRAALTTACAAKTPWKIPGVAAGAGTQIVDRYMPPPSDKKPPTPYYVPAGMTGGQKLAIAGGVIAAAGIWWFVRKRKG